MTAKANRYEMRNGVAARVELKDEAGEIVATVMVPYDPDNQPSEDEIAEKAWHLRTVTEHIRERITPEDIEETAEHLRTGEYGKMFARLMREYMQSGVRVSMTPDDKTPENLAEAEEATSEALTIIRDQAAMIVNAYLEESPFWRDFAHAALTHAWTWALEDLKAEEPDILESPKEEFHLALIAKYRDGGYLYGAVMTLTDEWAQFLWAGIAAGFKEEDGTPGPIAQRIEELARERVHKRRPKTPPVMRPVFDPSGYGYSPSDGISAGAIRALAGPGVAWKVRDDGYPEFRHTWGGIASRGTARIAGSSQRQRMRSRPWNASVTGT